MAESEAPKEVASTSAGWYEHAGGLRLWDGSGWTEHYAPPERVPLSESHIAWAVFKGTLAALVVFAVVASLLFGASLS